MAASPPAIAGVFYRHITLHRFVRAGTAREAESLASCGVELHTGELLDLWAVVEQAAVVHQRAALYRHAGEADLWWVSIDVHATVRAPNVEAASEAAHQVITVSELCAITDVFQYEIQLLDTVSALVA